jgi:hypothetical protein
MNKFEKIVYNKPFVLICYFGLSLFAVVKSVIVNHIHDNYFVYKYAFFNIIHQQTPFGPVRGPGHDLYHYGPVFAIIMAPFAFLPDSTGVILWVMFNAGILYLAVKWLPLRNNAYLPILLICAHELMTSSSNVEINPMIGALIILSYVLIKDKKDFWAALAICLGVFIKLYGIVGLAFFFCSENKVRFILSLLFWSVILFVAPMIFTSPAYILKNYHDWYFDLLQKNQNNIGPSLQDISLMGLIRNIFNYRQLSNAVVIIPGLVLFATWYTGIKYFHIAAAAAGVHAYFCNYLQQFFGIADLYNCRSRGSNLVHEPGQTGEWIRYFPAGIRNYPHSVFPFRFIPEKYQGKLRNSLQAESAPLCARLVQDYLGDADA